MPVRVYSTKTKVGDHYGRLTVVKRVENVYGKTPKFLCVCACGNMKEVVGQPLRNGITRSCGCLQRESLFQLVEKRRLKPGEAAKHEVFSNNKRGAKNRDIEWRLSEEEFHIIGSKTCAYCGVPPSNTTKEKYGVYGVHVYNGVDRVNPTLGYFRTNCSPCCWMCNRFKQRMSLEKFLSWAQKVCRRQPLGTYVPIVHAHKTEWIKQPYGTGRSPLSQLWCQYRSDAKRYGREFLLTKQQFYAYVKSPCFYCGEESSLVGIDRIDNCKGYAPGNIVPCCTTCNYAKNSSTQQEFLSHVQRIIEYQRGIRSYSTDNTTDFAI